MTIEIKSLLKFDFFERKTLTWDYFFSPRFSILRMRIAMITVKLFSNPCFSLKRQICVSFSTTLFIKGESDMFPVRCWVYQNFS